MTRDQQALLYGKHREGCLIKVRGVTVSTIKKAASGYCSAVIPAPKNRNGKKQIPLDTVEAFDVAVYTPVDDWLES
ncbi:hypothetical protein MYOV003v1_p0069 [Vibrio phage 207E48.1]|nr:hypothetical protein MYOV003v1_p0069 [Vibrio phage 207E48.1]